jgi:phosphoadenosine phosphosulfate reductase
VTTTDPTLDTRDDARPRAMGDAPVTEPSLDTLLGTRWVESVDTRHDAAHPGVPCDAAPSCAAALAGRLALAGEPADAPTTPAPVPTAVPDLAELAEISRRLESRPASKVIEWAWERFGTGLVLAASFQDCVLLDVAAKVAFDLEVVFLDTQYHFAETLWYVEQIRERYDLNLTTVSPLVQPDNRWMDDVDSCCAVRKVEPLNRALAGRAAWMSGMRRDESPTRARTPIVSWDISRGLVKVNPLATWTDDDVEGYVRDHGLPQHPLRDRGYPSIGCWPCTRPVAEGEDPRSGRWGGAKSECGIHA